ncbi:hypothetical protein FB451DRAFT_1310696 [Mycena latifolia]|nr:hypothetical protein FB451DRAFT_1310696 [Mycena latifolia]
MPKRLNLRTLWTRRRRPTQTIIPYSLPLELWELVLEELSDESLRTVARVCSVFNDRCITLYLSRHEISPKSLATGILHIHSPLLSVLQLSRLTPQIHTFVCHFWAFRVLRDMKFLREFIRRLHSITELHLSFTDDLLTAHTIDTIFPYSPHALVKEFCGVIRAMVAKSGAPVVVITGGYLYRVRPQDLQDWGFRYFLPWTHCFGHIPWVDNAWSVLRAEPHMSIPVWSGLKQTFHYPRVLRSVNVRCIPTAAGPLTLIIFEKNDELAFNLGPSIFFKDAIPSSQLTKIIPFITLPSLRNLYINEDVEPTALHEFLLRHPTIFSISYKKFSKTKRNLPRLRLLTSSPLVLPSLADLRCDDVDQLIPLLDTFGLSPHLYCIGFTFARNTVPQIAALKSSMRRLSLHTTAVQLHIFILRDRTEDQLPIDDEERQIVGCLYSVRWMHISLHHLSEVPSLIPWLGMLPALARLKFSVWSEAPTPDEGAIASMLEVVRAALPWVPNLEITP